MKIKNKKNKSNYLNYRVSGVPKKVIIPAGKTIDISAITNVAQIINFGDFNRGFFEVVTEEIKKQVASPIKASKKKKYSKKKKKTEDTFDKVEKEVKDYTDNDNKK